MASASIFRSTVSTPALSRDFPFFYPRTSPRRGHAEAGDLGCEGSASPFFLAAIAATSAADELLVAAAVSLREPLEAVAQRFEAARPGTRVQLAFGASSALTAQAKAGAPFDVFLAADEESVDALAAAYLLRAGSRRVFAGNRLVVIASAELKVPIEGAADLSRPEVRRIALAERAVPVGHYAREWLAGRGAARGALAAHRHHRARACDAGGGGRRDAEAGIVYATDMKAARSARVAFTPPDPEQPRIVYVAAQLESARCTRAGERVPRGARRSRGAPGSR